MQTPLLSIDFGLSKAGIAISRPLPEPLEVFRYKKQQELVERIEKLVKQHGIETLVLGVSERDSAILAHEFGEKLSKELNLDVVFVDETLTTYDAQEYMKAAGKGRGKRSKEEDAWSAALILQRYLDSL